MTICKGCGKDEELRLGFCFDCASSGEHRLAKRTVLQHIAHSYKNLRHGWWWEFRCDWRMAFQRLFRVGDYKKDGYFDLENIDWR